MACKDSLILEEITSDDTKEIINDLKLSCETEMLEYLKSEFKDIYEKIPSDVKTSDGKVVYTIEFALDDDIFSMLENINKTGDLEDEFFLFKKEEAINKIWITILEKSIKCLRFFDKREPFF